jgi:hypothetical protein
MIPSDTKERLLANWLVADSMACYAECKIYDPLSRWACYILAINPLNEDEILCIFTGLGVTIETYSMSSIRHMYNTQGEPPQLDKEYRRMWASELFKKLNDGE